MLNETRFELEDRRERINRGVTAWLVLGSCCLIFMPRITQFADVISKPSYTGTFEAIFGWF